MLVCHRISGPTSLVWQWSYFLTNEPFSDLLTTAQCPHHSANPVGPTPETYPQHLHHAFFWVCPPCSPTPWPLPDVFSDLRLGPLPEPLTPRACPHAPSTRVYLSCCYQYYSLILQMQSQFCTELNSRVAFSASGSGFKRRNHSFFFFFSF